MLKSAGGRPGDRFKALFHAFSRKSTTNYGGPEAVHWLWESVCKDEPRPGARPLTVGTLRRYAKEDSPVEYARWAARKRDREHPRHVADDEDENTVVSALARADDPGEISRASATRASATSGEAMEGARRLLTAMGLRDGEVVDLEPPIADERSSSVSFAATMHVADGTAGRCTVRLGLKDLRAVLTLEDGTVVHDGFLNKETGIEVGQDLCRVHAAIPADQTWTVTRPSARNVVFTGAERGSEVSLCNADRPQGEMVARVKVPDAKPHQVTNKGQIAFIQSAYHESVAQALTTMNMGWAVGIMNVNITVQQQQPPAAFDDDNRTDDGLMEAVLEAVPKLRELTRFSPASKTSSCNGLYCCDPETSVWIQRHNVVIEEMLVEAFGQMGTLSEYERRHVESRRGRGDMVHMMAAKVIDEAFLDKLDANLDVFAVANGCFDSSRDPSGAGRPRFRPLTPGDCVSTTTGWAYDAEEARRYRGEVDAFFEMVLPVPEERRVVLAYFASLLSGRRTVKKFLALTDEREGDNGKSTMVRLFALFFGGHVEENGTKFVCRASFDRDRDSHDAGTVPYRNKRLVVAEELKNTMTLDDAMLKRLAGGPGVTVGGRPCVWKAGFVLIFSDGDVPKFDNSDMPFINRMLVGPMRSKFVEAGSPVEDEYTFVKDEIIAERFIKWLPAVMDVMLDHFGVQNVFDASNLPPAMREWRARSRRQVG